MSGLRIIYLVLALIGTVVPLMYYIPWAQENTVSWSNLTAAWQVNLAATGLYWDMVIAATALAVWIMAETYARKDYWVLICLPLIVLIGISCALPLFLFLRTRPVT